MNTFSVYTYLQYKHMFKDLMYMCHKSRILYMWASSSTNEVD